jgi:hypothetical protein
MPNHPDNITPIGGFTVNQNMQRIPLLPGHLDQLRQLTLIRNWLEMQLAGIDQQRQSIIAAYSPPEGATINLEAGVIEMPPDTPPAS